MSTLFKIISLKKTQTIIEQYIHIIKYLSNIVTGNNLKKIT
jgi:hypothetical protein